MTKKEAIQQVKKEIRENGFEKWEIEDSFIEDWGSFYYDKHHGDLFEIYEGIMYEYDSDYYLDCYLDTDL